MHSLSCISFRVLHIFKEGNHWEYRIAKFVVYNKQFFCWDIVSSFCFEYFARDVIGLPRYRFYY